MDLVSIIILIGIAQGIFFGVLLLTLKRGNKKSNLLFGILMILFSVSISGFEMIRLNLFEKLPFLIGTTYTVVFLFGPLYFFYVKSLTDKNFRLRKRKLLHFLPFVLFLLYKLPFYIKSPEEKISYINQSFYQLESTIIMSIMSIHIFVYLYLVHKKLQEHLANIKRVISSVEKVNLNWIRIGMASFFIIFILIALFSSLYWIGINLFHIYQVIIPVMVSLTILFLGYWSISQPIIIPVEEEQKVKKYEKSSLTDELANGSLRKLIRLMENEKFFMKSDITLNKLADELMISPHHLSQIINEKTNQNFFDFINSYRIEEAKKLLVDPKGELLTILAIADEVGFNSKSAFNNAFKKNTGMTPTEYRNGWKEKAAKAL
jgi:AraC-like DNA-binding protein